MRWVLNIEIDNKKKSWIDLARRACRVKVFVPGDNIVVGRPRWSSSYARFLVSLRARK